jgi:3-oxoacyl-[acyl-carrier protein] reductase
LARLTRMILPDMIEQKWGRVLTISSIYGREAGGRPWFAAAKSAQIALMKSLSRTPEYVRNGITFNTVAPGAIMIPDTGWDKLQKKNPTEYNRILEDLPMGRMGTPEDVANVVTFLCSDAARFVNGSCVVVDGGESRSF